MAIGLITTIGLGQVQTASWKPFIVTRGAKARSCVHLLLGYKGFSARPRIFSAVLREAEEKHHATALAPLGTEPIHVYRKSILGPRLAIPNTVLEHCYHQAN